MGLRIADRVLSRLPGFLGWKTRGEDEEGGLKVRAKPVRDSVRWSPFELSEFDRAADRRRPHELFVRQSVFRKARGQLTGSGERFGFLLGRRFFCRDCGSPWMLVSDILPASVALPGRGENPRFRLLCAAAAEQAADGGYELVGWYHEHRHLGVALTDHEVALHRENFPEPWQCVLMFVTGREQPAGSFIQPWQGERYFGRSLVSFRELIEKGDARTDSDAPPLSTVDWCNYAPERPVERGERLVLGGEPDTVVDEPSEPPAVRADPGTGAGEAVGAATRASDWSPPVEVRLHSTRATKRPGRDGEPSSERAAEPSEAVEPSERAVEPSERTAEPVPRSAKADLPSPPPPTRALHDVVLLLPPEDTTGLRKRLPLWLRRLLPRR